MEVLLGSSARPQLAPRFRTIPKIRYETEDGQLDCVDILSVRIRTEAGEEAETWARQKRGNMALVYNRKNGVVLAQYCQSQDGILGYLLYTSSGRLGEQHNAYLFEPLPGDAQQEPREDVKQGQARLPFTGTVPICTYPVRDDSEPTREWWYAQRPSNSGLWVSVYPDRPSADENGGEDPLVTAVLEVFGGQLRILWWDRGNLEGDPHVLVIESDLASIPLTRLAVLQQIGTEKA